MSRVLARELVCHPDTPSSVVSAIHVELVSIGEGDLCVDFIANGEIDSLVLPEPTLAVHTDGLWRTTCFELFLALPGGRYVEVNLSPSSAFAAYHFDRYRDGMTALTMRAPQIRTSRHLTYYRLSAPMAGNDLPWDQSEALGLSAVIADHGGGISYWALAHPTGRPDFHDRSCFTAQLPPRSEA